MCGEGNEKEVGAQKSSAAGFFGVAQSPKSSYGGTRVMLPPLPGLARGVSKKVQNFLNLPLNEKMNGRNGRSGLPNVDNYSERASEELRREWEMLRENEWTPVSPLRQTDHSRWAVYSHHSMWNGLWTRIAYFS